MRKKILFIVFLNFYALMLGQVNEIGISIGGSNYVGDIGRTTYIYPNQLAGAIFYKYNWNPRIAFRASYRFLPIRANDINATTDFKREKGFHFSNLINEFAVGIEWNFYPYDLSEDRNWTPYISLEFAGFNYKYVKSELSSTSQYLYNHKTSYTIPLGIGFKSKLYGNFAFSLETSFRYTLADDLDYSTDKIPSLNFGRQGNDWYMFTGFSLIYTFGRPPCY